MQFPIETDDRSEDGELGFVARTMLGMVRLASLPFLLLVIVLASMIYALAILIRFLIAFGEGLRRFPGLARAWYRPVESRDA